MTPHFNNISSNSMEFDVTLPNRVMDVEWHNNLVRKASQWQGDPKWEPSQLAALGRADLHPRFVDTCGHSVADLRDMELLPSTA